MNKRINDAIAGTNKYEICGCGTGFDFMVTTVCVTAMKERRVNQTQHRRRKGSFFLPGVDQVCHLIVALLNKAAS